MSRLDKLCINENKYENKYENIDLYKIQSCIKIQSWVRGVMYRKKSLPLVLYVIQNYMLNQISFQCSNQVADGRINSCIDEKQIIELLIKEFNKNTIRIKISKDRMWYDLLIYDYLYRWIPVNIKTTTTMSKDNIGNLSLCVYAYTNEKLDLYKKQDNGKMANILINKLKNKEYNNIDKKDYYFLIFNKNKDKDKDKDIIINSLKGLEILTPNNNNLPFQVCWNKNRYFIYKPIKECIKLFINCQKIPKEIWKEKYLRDIRQLTL